MDLNEIKKLIEEDGGKIIVVENGQPVLVVTSFEDYKKKTAKPDKKIKNPIPKELDGDDLKIEDLPF